MKRIAAIQVFDFKNVKKGELEFTHNAQRTQLTLYISFKKCLKPYS